jgi:hypothetical protein
MSSLDGRVKALEGQRRQARGCPRCHGQAFIVYDPAVDDVSWLDPHSCCRGCGAGVKVYFRDLWEQL